MLGIRKRKRLRELAAPFHQAAHIIKLVRIPDGEEPLRDLLPGRWPTFGQLDELLKELDNLTKDSVQDG